MLLFLLAGPLAEIASSISARGTFTFKYTTGTETIVSIVYALPQDLADVLVPEQTEGWTVTLAGDSLSVTDGTLNPGESVTVNYRLKEYIKGGPRTITATATTANGDALKPDENTLQVPDALLLAIVGMFSSIWLLILAIIVLVIIIVLFIIGNNKDEEQEKTERKTGPASPPKSG